MIDCLIGAESLELYVYGEFSSCVVYCNELVFHSSSGEPASQFWCINTTNVVFLAEKQYVILI